MRRPHLTDFLIGAGVGTFLGLIVYGFACADQQSQWMAAMQPAPELVRPVPPVKYGTAVGMSATWYGSQYDGRPTASGLPYDSEQLTAAHKTLPFGTRLQVAYQGRQVEVVVTDRGPFTAGRDLDLSAAAFRALAPLERGVVRVAVRRAL